MPSIKSKVKSKIWFKMLHAFKWLTENWTTEKGKIDAVMLVTKGIEPDDPGSVPEPGPDDDAGEDGDEDGVMDAGETETDKVEDSWSV